MRISSGLQVPIWLVLAQVARLHAWGLRPEAVSVEAHGMEQDRLSLTHGGALGLTGKLEYPEAIVVMGQLLKEDGSATAVLERRIKKTASVFSEEGKSAPVVVSGGDPHDRGVTEAEVMEKMLVERDVPAELVLKENASANTVQNALYVLDMVGAGCHTLHLVTSDFHMPRCAYIYEAVLKSKKREDIKLVRHPVSGGCPAASTAGEDASDGSYATVNDMTYLERLRLERKFLKNEEHYLKKDSPKAMAVAPLPKSRLLHAQQEVDQLIEEEEQRQARKVAAESGSACLLCSLPLMILLALCAVF